MRKWILPITLVCLISGLLIALQFKVQASLSSNPLEQRNANLIAIIKDLEKDIKELENQNDSFRKEITDYENTKSTGFAKTQKLQQELKRAKMIAGLLPVSGPGITIVVDDNKAGLLASPNDDPNKYIIHYENILNIISELRVGKAEALSINGQRFVSPTEIRCVGNVILVNTTRLAPPFEIRAIGQPDLLEDIITSGEYELLKNSGFPVSLKKDVSVKIPAYKGSYQFNFLQEVK